VKRVRIRKNVLMLSLIASFLMAMAVVPSYANSATLAVDPPETVTSDPFLVNINVDDVVQMFGYHFKLVYDTSVLTATAFVSWAPFDTAQGPWGPDGGVINDAEGYVEMAWSYPMGEEYGLTTSDPVPVAAVAFDVDGLGASPLQIKASPPMHTIGDVYGNEIPSTAMCGEFRTSAGLPVAKFVWTPGGEDPYVDELVTFTSTSTDPDGMIVAWDWDFGDGSTGAGEMVTHTYTMVNDYLVTLTVTDNDGKMDSQVRAMIISPVPEMYGPVDLRNAHAAHRRFSVSVRDPATINKFTAWVKNLDSDGNATLVRVMWTVTSGGVGLGGLVAEGWMAPMELAKFTADFDVTDPTWEFDGERKDYEISVSAWYADLWIGDLPHFTEGTYSGSQTNWFRVTTLP
jgi:PKD repeat protein